MEFFITEIAKQKIEEKFICKTLRIYPKIRTWSGITYIMVQDEPKENDSTYEVDNIIFLIDTETEKDTSYIEIDYVSEWWDEDFIITAGF